MITQREKEEFKKIELIVESYGNIDDMFNDLKAKLEIYSNLSLNNTHLEYALAVYSDDLKILVEAIQLKLL